MQTQDPDQTKNVLLAVLLSIAVLFAWQVFYAGPKMEEEQERQRRLAAEQQQQTQTSTGGTNTGQTAPGIAGPGAATTGPAAGGVLPRLTTVDRATALKSTERVSIETPSIIGSINLQGGRIDDITLVKYHVEPDPESPRVVVFSPATAPKPYFADIGWRAPAATKTEMPGPDTQWTVAQGGTLSPSSPITLTWTNAQGVTFTREFRVDENYMLTVRASVQNAGNEPLTLFPSGAIYRYGVPEIENFFIQHEGLIGVLGENGFTEIDYSGAASDGGGKTVREASGGWLGFTDKYWASALIPDQSRTFNATLDSLTPTDTPESRQQFAANFASQAVIVEPGASASNETRLYVGAKQVNLIEGYQDQFGVRQFELMVDWGWFYFITKPLYHLLDWLYKFFGNFGFAILAVTVIVKALFFWFANKSYESMAKMKKLQPEMERLRERYKDDKTEQQKQLMQLYQKEKINPLAGCLPVLIQIPVFFALYKVLFISIDMRHAPFVGWIQDLSAPDPTSLFNLFGILPYVVPDWVPPLGIWPVIMGITMWLQMQLNPQQPDPMQQAIFNWMPIVFTFLLASFPAGLVVYWAWNNILSLAQQYMIMKRQGADIHLLDNLKKTAGAAKGAAGAARRTAGDLRSRNKKS